MQLGNCTVGETPYLVGVIPAGNFSINVTFFFLICPYSGTPASLKTASSSQSFQIFRQQTMIIYEWYFYNPHSGCSLILSAYIPGFHPTNKKHMQTNKKVNVS